MLFYSSGRDNTIVAAKDISWLDVENRSKPRSKHYQFIMTGARTETRDHGRACMLGASRFEKKHDARKAAWFTTATVIGAISAFVDSIGLTHHPTDDP